MDFWTDDQRLADADADQVEFGIKSLGLEEFAILGPSDEVYIQTMLTEHGYLLEKREGSDDAHFEAVPVDGRPRVGMSAPWWGFWMKPKAIYFFTVEEIITAFCNYREGNDTPELLRWNKIKL